jgi:hypothetical protein
MRPGRTSIAALLLCALLAVTHLGAQEGPTSTTLAAQAVAYTAMQEFLADPDASQRQRLGVIARGGAASEAVAAALIEEFRTNERAVADVSAARAACQRAGVTWGSPDPFGAREVAILAEGCNAEAVLLVQADITATQPDGTVNVFAVLSLEDPRVLGSVWSIDVEAEGRARQNVGQSFWQKNPKLVGGVIAGLILVWLISALRRRAKS